MTKIFFTIIWGMEEGERVAMSWSLWKMGDNYMSFFYEIFFISVCFMSEKNQKQKQFSLTFKNSYNLDLVIYFSSFIVNFSSIQSHIQSIVKMSLHISFLKSMPLFKLFFLSGMFFSFSFSCWTPFSEPEFSLL